MCESEHVSGARIWNVSVHGVQDVLGLELRATHYHGGQQ